MFEAGKRQLILHIRDIGCDGKVKGHEIVSPVISFDIENIQDIVNLHGRDFLQKMILEKFAEWMRDKIDRKFGDL